MIEVTPICLTCLQEKSKKKFYKKFCSHECMVEYALESSSWKIYCVTHSSWHDQDDFEKGLLDECELYEV